MVNKILIERVIKAIAYWNGCLEFDRRFLVLLDNFDLVIEEEGGLIRIKTKMRTRMKEGIQ